MNSSSNPIEAFSLQKALELAYAAKRAYDEAPAIRSHHLSAGFSQCDVLTCSGSQVFIASDPERVLISFRGTQATFGQWLRNLQVYPSSHPLGSVHGGFSDALDEVWQNLLVAFDLHGVPSKPVCLTGHSLGAAEAALCAARMHSEGIAERIECLYTFGQPRLAGSEFQAAFDPIFRSRFYRFVNQWDIVPRVPPGYRHVGTPKRITSEGTLEMAGPLAVLFGSDEGGGELLEADQAPLSEEQFDLLKEYIEAIPPVSEAKLSAPLADELVEEGVLDFATDHFMDAYIDELQKLIVA